QIALARRFQVGKVKPGAKVFAVALEDQKWNIVLVRLLYTLCERQHQGMRQGIHFLGPVQGENPGLFLAFDDQWFAHAFSPCFAMVDRISSLCSPSDGGPTAIRLVCPSRRIGEAKVLAVCPFGRGMSCTQSMCATCSSARISEYWLIGAQGTPAARNCSSQYGASSDAKIDSMISSRACWCCARKEVLVNRSSSNSSGRPMT